VIGRREDGGLIKNKTEIGIKRDRGGNKMRKVRKYGKERYRESKEDKDGEKTTRS
jgi:hypothetical protein